MTTVRDVRKLVKPVLEARNDLLLWDRFLICVPFRRLFKGVLIDRRGDPKRFAPNTVCSVLYNMRNGPSAFGRRIDRPNTNWLHTLFGRVPLLNRLPGTGYSNPLWFITDADYPDALRDAIISAIDQEVWPLETIEDCLRWKNEASPFEVSGPDPFDYLALGQFGNFKHMADGAPKYYRTKELNGIADGLGDRLVKHGNDLPREDKRAIIDYLHQRERAAVTRLKLEKYWQPTPFPAEEKGLV